MGSILLFVDVGIGASTALVSRLHGVGDHLLAMTGILLSLNFAGPRWRGFG
jgi:hypothetical protein